jgi:hypothetical protein
LLERAFAKQGGAIAALAEARDGTHGGMRSILDILTEELKTEEQGKEVLRAFQALDPTDWAAKVAFIGAFLKRHAADLGAEIASAPPERYANQYELIVRTYVGSMDRVKELLRRF